MLVVTGHTCAISLACNINPILNPEKKGTPQLMLTEHQ
jgi:hypothetical protein